MLAKGAMAPVLSNKYRFLRIGHERKLCNYQGRLLSRSKDNNHASVQQHTPQLIVVCVCVCFVLVSFTLHPKPYALNPRYGHCWVLLSTAAAVHFQQFDMFHKVLVYAVCHSNLKKQK